MRLRAERAVYGGYSLGKADGKVVFLKGALPGELVEAQPLQEKRHYILADTVQVLEPSPQRVQPPCPYFGRCGGCQMQHISYPGQLELKAQVLREALQRLGALEVQPGEPLAGQPLGYRHRGQFKLSPEGEMGFFREGTREVVPIKQCLLMKEPINQALQALKEVHLSGLKELHITSGQDGLMASVLGPEGFQEQLAEALAGAGLGTVAFQDGSYRGRGYVSLNLGGMPFTVGPWSFMQSNWALNVALVELLVESLREALSGAVVLDAYAGGGNFTLPLARLARQVVAVEENPHAVEDGRRNARLGGLDNIRWIQAPVERAPLKGREFQVAVLDPPRAGLTKEALRRLTELHPQWIAYVSCNPTTLARDLRGLLGGYELCGLRMVDMFPQTYHIEALVLLRAKGAG